MTYLLSEGVVFPATPVRRVALCVAVTKEMGLCTDRKNHISDRSDNQIDEHLRFWFRSVHETVVGGLPPLWSRLTRRGLLPARCH